MKKNSYFSYLCTSTVIRQGWTPPPLEKFSGSAPGMEPKTKLKLIILIQKCYKQFDVQKQFTLSKISTNRHEIYSVYWSKIPLLATYKISYATEYLYRVGHHRKLRKWTVWWIKFRHLRVCIIFPWQSFRLRSSPPFCWAYSCGGCTSDGQSSAKAKIA